MDGRLHRVSDFPIPTTHPLKRTIITQDDAIHNDPDTLICKNLNFQLAHTPHLPVLKLLILDRCTKIKPIVVFKHYFCNSKVVSKDLVERYRNFLQVQKAKSIIHHSDKNQTETSSKIVVRAQVKIVEQTYTSNYIFANRRSDFLLGTSCHYRNDPSTDYGKSIVSIDCKTIKERISLEPTT